MSRMAAVAATLAAGVFLMALAGFGAAHGGYSPTLHPPALLGARGIAYATAFNLIGFVLPGLLAVVVALGLRAQLDGARPIARIGTWLWLLSALAFAAQGLLPLDPSDLDAPPSRLHATAWNLWWVAFVPGGVLLAIGLGDEPRWRALRWVAATAAVLVPLFAVLSPLPTAPGVAQRVALAAWFGGLLVAGFAAQRRSQP